MGHNLVDDGLGIPLPVLGKDGIPIKAPRGGLGRWGSTSTPHRGWHYDAKLPFLNAAHVLESHIEQSIADQIYWGEKDDRTTWPTCQMCQGHAISKIHRLVHPDFPFPLHVGSDCAEYMIGAPALRHDVVDEADRARVRKIEADAKFYKRLDYEGGAEWNEDTRPRFKNVRCLRSGMWGGEWVRKGQTISMPNGVETFWWARIYGMRAEVTRVGDGWRGWFRHRGGSGFNKRSGVVDSRELAQRLTRRAALIAWRTKPWKGEAELADYKAMMALRLTGRDA